MYPNYQGLVLLKYNWGLFSTVYDLIVYQYISHSCCVQCVMLLVPQSVLLGCIKVSVHSIPVLLACQEMNG